LGNGELEIKKLLCGFK